MLLCDFAGASLACTEVLTLLDRHTDATWLIEARMVVTRVHLMRLSDHEVEE